MAETLLYLLHQHNVHFCSPIEKLGRPVKHSNPWPDNIKFISIILVHAVCNFTWQEVSHNIIWHNMMYHASKHSSVFLCLCIVNTYTHGESSSLSVLTTAELPVCPLIHNWCYIPGSILKCLNSSKKLWLSKKSILHSSKSSLNFQSSFAGPKCWAQSWFMFTTDLKFRANVVKNFANL